MKSFDSRDPKPLSQLSKSLLLNRAQGLAKNLFFSEGVLSIPENVRKVYDDTFAELEKRGIKCPRLEVESLIARTDPTPRIHDKTLVRYAGRNRLEDFVAGKVAFGSSHKYDELENAAQKDDEMKRLWHVPDMPVTISGISYPGSNIRIARCLEPTKGSPRSYHILALSFEESPKLQRAFEADAYVLINDPQVFFDTLKKAISEQLLGACLAFGEVEYFDDLETPKFELVEDKKKAIKGTVLSKSILFQYQREARFVIFGAQESEKHVELTVRWPKGLISAIKTFG